MTLRTGEVASAAGVNIQTLRYYERRGLLPEPGRSLGGHRGWSPEAVTLVRVIKAAQRLGFSLDEVAELLDAGAGARARPALRDRASTKLAEIDAKIADLMSMRSVLAEVVDAGCDDLADCSCHPDCPIPFSDIAELPRGGHGDE